MENAFLKEANVVKTGTSLLLETQHKWESTQRNCLVKTEARQKYTPREKGLWSSSLMKRRAVKRRLNHLYRAVLPGVFFFFNFGQLSGFFFHT